MIGASHGNNFTLWLQGTNAGPGLVDLVVKPTPTTLEREIIDAVSKQDNVLWNEARVVVA